MRNFCAILVATGLAIAPVAQAETLAPGKPAGVRAAQVTDTTPLILLGITAAAIGIAVAASSNNNTVTPPPSTT